MLAESIVFYTYQEITLVVHLVREHEGEDGAEVAHLVEEANEIGVGTAADHIVDGADVARIIIAEEFVGDVDVVLFKAGAVGGGVGNDLINLDAHYLCLAALEETLLAEVEEHEDEDDEQACSDGNGVHAGADGEADAGRHPDAGRRGEATDTAFHLNDGTGTEETDTADDLCRDASRVAVLETHIFLRDIDGDEHSEGGAHRDEGEGTHTSYLTFVTAFETYDGTKAEGEEEFEDGSDDVDVRVADEG